MQVALPTEGVDRNAKQAAKLTPQITSPSPRRAWIEIHCCFTPLSWIPVALPTEGVDRNKVKDGTVIVTRRSPSPRRAWIEICCNVWEWN